MIPGKRKVRDERPLIMSPPGLITSGDLTWASPSASITVYTKHVQLRLDGGIAVNVCDRIHEACAYEGFPNKTVSALQMLGA